MVSATESGGRCIPFSLRSHLEVDDGGVVLVGAVVGRALPSVVSFTRAALKMSVSTTVTTAFTTNAETPMYTGTDVKGNTAIEPPKWAWVAGFTTL
jgi:hypothetical protein